MLRRTALALGVVMLASSCGTDAVVTARALPEAATPQVTEPVVTVAPAPEPPPTATPIPAPTPAAPGPELAGWVTSGFSRAWQAPPRAADEPNVEARPNNLRFLFDGIGTYSEGFYPLGSEIDPVIEMVSVSLGMLPQDNGSSLDWGEPLPALRIFVAEDRVIGYEVDLTQWNFADPVFVGEDWLFDGPFPVDELTVGDNTLAPVAYDDQGRLVRCSEFTTCLHQPVVLGPGSGSGDQSPFLQPDGLGPVERISAGRLSINDLLAVNSVSSIDQSSIKVHEYPSSENRIVVEIPNEDAVDIPVLGPPIDTGRGGTWFRILIPGHPLVPAGYIDGAAVTFGSTATDDDRPLPRVDRRPDELAGLIGLVHHDPFKPFSQVSPAGLDFYLVSYAEELNGVTAAGPDLNLRVSEYVTNSGRDRVFTLSKPIEEEGLYELAEVWTMNTAPGQTIVDAVGLGGPCPLLDGGDNDNFAKIIVDTDFRPAAGWVWFDFDFQRLDVSQIVCDGQS